ncbi:MAG TPA: hypothetical protein VF676_03460 [Flavobacterium sp.]
MKIYLMLLAFLFCCCANKHAEAKESSKSEIAVSSVNDHQEIVPGKSVGDLQLGADASGLEALGAPDFSDSAMGKAWLTWIQVEPDSVVNVFTTYENHEMIRKVIRQVRVTSSLYTLSSGISVGSDLALIQSAFPELKLVGIVAASPQSQAVNVYSDTNLGIAFEIRNRQCVGILIFKPEPRYLEFYGYLNPQMKPL